MKKIIQLELNPSKNSPWIASELEYPYKYDPKRRAYIGRSPGAEEGSVLDATRPFLIILRYSKFSRDIGTKYRCRAAAGRRPNGRLCLLSGPVFQKLRI
jgi:hypothetical protein